MGGIHTADRAKAIRALRHQFGCHSREDRTPTRAVPHQESDYSCSRSNPPLTWEYRFITIAVRPPQWSHSQGGEAPPSQPAKPEATTHPRPESSTRPVPAARVAGISPSYQELEFPENYGTGAQVNQTARSLPRAKQVEQVVNRLAKEGWEYVALEVLLQDQVLVMRRRQDHTSAEEQPADSRQPWWRIARKRRDQGT